MRKLAVVFFIVAFFVAFSAEGQRRRPIRSRLPYVFQAAIDYSVTDGALSRVFGPLPVDTKVTKRVIQPDGSVVLEQSIVIWPSPVPTWWALMSTENVGPPWNGPLPVDWPAGVTKFQVHVMREGKQYIVTNRVAVNIPTILSVDPLFAVAYSDGAIKLIGHDIVVAVGSERVGMLELQAGNFIPAGQIKQFPVTITGCWEVPPEVNIVSSLECATVVAKQ